MYSRYAKTLTPLHMKQVIMSENQFDFLRELVKNIPDISVSEEVGHESSPGPPLDLSIQSCYSSKPSTSCESSLSPTRNGNSGQSNGVQNSCTPNTSATTISPASSVTQTTEYRTERKRQWDTTRSSGKQTEKTSVIRHTSDSTECVPPKLNRMDSAPVNDANQISKSSTKRLMHQSKSVPCTSKEALNNQPVVPAPIVNIDICNKPIVKIDYSHLALDDKDSISSGSLSEQSTSINTCISPVINIDLSKITPQICNDLQNVTRTTTAPLLQSLDVDEDYDNI